MVKLARWSAGALVAAFVLVTLVPIGARPVLVESANFERAAAYALLGLLLALAFPRRVLLALLVAVAVAGSLELAQELSASRHARTIDFLVKAAAAAGAILALSGARLLAAPPR